MNTTTSPSTPPNPTAPPKLSLNALKIAGFRWHLLTFMLVMMADNVEHVISYWMIFQKFHSPELGGFAVFSHWLPFLLFSVPAGALADRFDPRRLIQIGVSLFIICSAGWAYLFITDTVEVWSAMTLLVLHGFSGVFWLIISQILLYDIVDPQTLPSAIRILATGRYLGLLIGPAVGGFFMLTAGPKYGLLWNILIYLPALIWLMSAPYGPKYRIGEPPMKRAVKGLSDIIQTIKDVKPIKPIAIMILLCCFTSLLVGNSYQAQMPAFAEGLGHGNPGVLYSLLLAADAGGALFAGILLESRGLLKPHPRTALLLALAWCATLFSFAVNGHYLLAILLLFMCGFFELSFNSMAQSIVQTNAPMAIRGRVIGLFNMASMGLRIGSGVTVGVVGGWIGIHFSLGIATLSLMAVIVYLLYRHQLLNAITSQK